jgi:hypothetical protein
MKDVLSRVCRQRSWAEIAQKLPAPRFSYHYLRLMPDASTARRARRASVSTGSSARVVLRTFAYAMDKRSVSAGRYVTMGLDLNCFENLKALPDAASRELPGGRGRRNGTHEVSSVCK